MTTTSVGDMTVSDIIYPTNIFKNWQLSFKLEASLLHNALFLFLLVYTVFYLIVFAILFYHWEKYGMGNRKIFIYGMVFTTVSILLFLLAYGLVMSI
jgi:hypothetical protein